MGKFLRGTSLTLLLVAVEGLRMRCIRNGLRFDMEFLRIESGIQAELDTILSERREQLEARAQVSRR